MNPTMTGELASKYNPAEVEPQVLQRWAADRAFHAEPGDGGPPYCIVIPPPNVTAALHMGHALNNTLQDILIRWRRMLGDNAVWIPGTDHAGIATQTVVEKRVLAEEGKRRTDFQREDFVARIQAWKDEYERRITEQLKRMGCSCDWDRQRFTMDPVCAAAVREAFFRLFKDGLIYRGKRLVNWDPATQTALADDEVEMREIDGHFWYLRYPLVEPVTIDGRAIDHVTVATTRPETMLGDTAVAINPRDPRAAALRGKKVRLPIVNRIVPIIEDDYVVLPNPDSEDPKARYATGFLKVTPAHDPNDWEIGQRHGLPIINVMGPDAAISDQHGWPLDDFARADREALPLGLDRYEAREAIVDWFRKNHLLEDVRPYRHSVGHSYRSHVPIEPYLSDQWYVATKRQIPSLPDEGLIPGTDVPRNSLAGLALRAMAPEQGGLGQVHGLQCVGFEPEDWEGRLRFHPARYASTFRLWHENIRDWCISRQLWWGHRIPAWRSPGAFAAWEGEEEQAENFLKKLGAWEKEGRIARYERKLSDLGPAENRGQEEEFYYYCLRDEKDEEILASLKKWQFKQDPDVLDTWFSSALWPFSTLGWPDPGSFPDVFPEGEAALRTWNPGSVLCTAREIITLWVSRMVMFNLYFLGRLPFTDVFIHAMIQDGEGRKMSKSLGNGVDPLDIIHSHGSDAMRYTLAAMTTDTQDVRLPVTKDPQTGRNTSEKFDLGRNFANKLWNAGRFALQNLESAEPSGAAGDNAELTLADRWILSRLAQVVRDTDAALTGFQFSSYAQGLYDFFWRDLCDWYIEAVKPTLKSNPPQRRVLASCLDVALRLLHPVMPFVTEKLWERLNEVAPARGVAGVTLAPSPLLVRAAWPKVDASVIDAEAEATVAGLQRIVVALRQVRTTHKVPPRQKVPCSIAAGADAASTIATHRGLIETLANVRVAQVAPDLAKPADAVEALADGVRLYLYGLVDPQAERARLRKRLEEVSRNVAALRGRLSNESYLAKAPANLVQQTRDQLAAAEREAADLERQLSAIG